MSTRISTCQTKHIDREPGEVVPRVAQILKRRWDAAASIRVVELVHECVDFKVVEPSTVQDSNKDPHLPSMTYIAGQPNTVYIVKPELQWCSCGIWQDVLDLIPTQAYRIGTHRRKRTESGLTVA
jgi:hypothetical protein